MARRKPKPEGLAAMLDERTRDLLYEAVNPLTMDGGCHSPQSEALLRLLNDGHGLVRADPEPTDALVERLELMVAAMEADGEPTWAKNIRRALARLRSMGEPDDERRSETVRGSCVNCRRGYSAWVRDGKPRVLFDEPLLATPTDEPEPTPDIGDGQPEEPPYVVYTDEWRVKRRVHWREPVVWQALYRAVKRGDTDTAERIWDQLPREGRRMHLPGLWGQPETRAWLEERGVDIEMRWETDDG